MGFRNTTTTWGSASKAFHWLTVLLLIVQGVLALTMGDFSQPTRGNLVNLHKSIGILILAFATARLVWVLYNGRPGPAPGVTALEYRLSRIVEGLLYVLLFATPITGWLMTAYGGKPIPFFGLFDLPPLVGVNHDLHEQFEGVHETLFWVMVVLAGGHAAAALYHQFVKRDSTLSRMMPQGWMRDPGE